MTFWVNCDFKIVRCVCSHSVFNRFVAIIVSGIAKSHARLWVPSGDLRAWRNQKTRFWEKSSLNEFFECKPPHFYSLSCFKSLTFVEFFSMLYSSKSKPRNAKSRRWRQFISRRCLGGSLAGLFLLCYFLFAGLTLDAEKQPGGIPGPSNGRGPPAADFNFGGKLRPTIFLSSPSFRDTWCHLTAFSVCCSWLWMIFSLSSQAFENATYPERVIFSSYQQHSEEEEDCDDFTELCKKIRMLFLRKYRFADNSFS